MQTRRNFLLISSAGVGGLCLVTKNGFAISRFRLKREEFAQTPETFAPAMMDEANTKALAHAAMDEARRLGAYYADIRLGETQHLLIGRFSPSPEPDLVISADRQYGIRVLVDGVWGIGTGVSFERDKITQIVGEAVAHAKRQAKALERTRAVRVELAPTVSQTGEWNTPVVIDPFTVPLRIQYEVLDGIGAGLSRTYEGGGNTFFRWWSQRRIFASTDDTFLLQRLKWSDIRVTGPENVPMPSLGPTGGGFEVVADPAWVDRAKAFADDVKEWYRLPITTSVDVGRYPILFDGAAASRFAYTLGLACEADRALGYEADAAGTSFLSPPRDILAASNPQFSPLVTLEANTVRPSGNGMRWDDEGVPFRPQPLIQSGRVVGYTATRETAPLLGGGDGGLYGGCVASQLNDVPDVNTPELVLSSATEGRSFSEMVKSMPDGLLARWGSNGWEDTGLTTMLSGAKLFQVKGGKVVGRVPEGFVLLTRVEKFWKDNLLEIGGSNTAQFVQHTCNKGMPWRQCATTVTAPAILVKDVDVVLAGARSSQ